MYRMREVNGHEDEIADTLAELYYLTFFNGARLPDFDQGHWWLAVHEANPVAFAAVGAGDDRGLAWCSHLKNFTIARCPASRAVASSL